MFDIDLRVGSGSGLPWQNSPGVILEGVLDLSTDPITSTKVAGLIPIPARTLFAGLQYDVLTAEGKAGVLKIGLYKADGTAVDDDGFFPTLNINSVAHGFTTPTVTQDGTTPFAVTIAPALWAPVYASEEYAIGAALVSGSAAAAKIKFRLPIFPLYK